MKIDKLTGWLLALLGSLSLTSCFNDDDDVDYSTWKETNEAYITKIEKATDENGSPLYKKVIPDWAPQTFSLVHWHNDPDLFRKELSPLDNSTVDIKYETYDIDDNLLNSSSSMHQYGDSIYRTSPSDMIIGVRSVLPLMHVGDSVSLVIPYTAAYGTTFYGKIKPFSTLKFNIKLVGIVGWEIP